MKDIISKYFSGVQPHAYQRASYEDGWVPLNSSASKYACIHKAASLFKEKFTFADFGCCNGLFGWLLVQDFGVSGKLYNVDQAELDSCKEIKARLNEDRIDISDGSVVYVKEQFDLTLYMSLLHHVLRQTGWTAMQVARMIDDQTKKVAVVEIPSSSDDALAHKVLGERKSKLDGIVPALIILGFDIVHREDTAQ
jgi:cyclopropane fatty-acyl-phospholipid synthase-like methyltransferase